MVVTSIAVKRVVAGSTVDQVTTVTTVKGVVPVIAAYQVITRRSAKGVVTDCGIGQCVASFTVR